MRGEVGCVDRGRDDLGGAGGVGLGTGSAFGRTVATTVGAAAVARSITLAV